MAIYQIGFGMVSIIKKSYSEVTFAKRQVLILEVLCGLASKFMA